MPINFSIHNQNPRPVNRLGLLPCPYTADGFHLNRVIEPQSRRKMPQAGPGGRRADLPCGRLLDLRIVNHVREQADVSTREMQRGRLTHNRKSTSCVMPRPKRQFDAMIWKAVSVA